MTLPRVPRFRRWVAAATCSTLGDSVSFFALSWAATGFGGGTAGLVLTCGSIPLAVLMLLGGVTADRWGIRRTMLVCDLVMALVMVLAAGALGLRGPLGLDAHGHTGLVVTLCAVSALSGSAAAMRRPASGVFPRLFVTPAELPQVLATVGAWAQVARIAGPAAGGVLVGAVGVGGAFALDALSFGLVSCALALVVPPRPDGGQRSGGSTWRAISASVSAARRTPGVPAALLAVSGLAASVLVLLMLAVPAFGHARGWGPSRTGQVSACWVVGSLLVTVVVARRGAPGRTVMCLGPTLGAGGAALLVWASGVSGSALGVGLVGVGGALTTTRLIPAFQELTPPTMLARFQALLQLAQTGAVLVMMPGVGFALSRTGPAPATLLLTAILLATTAALIRVPGGSGDHHARTPDGGVTRRVADGSPRLGEPVDCVAQLGLGPGVGDPDEGVEAAVGPEHRSRGHHDAAPLRLGRERRRPTASYAGRQLAPQRQPAAGQPEPPVRKPLGERRGERVTLVAQP